MLFAPNLNKQFKFFEHDKFDFRMLLQIENARRKVNVCVVWLIKLNAFPFPSPINRATKSNNFISHLQLAVIKTVF